MPSVNIDGLGVVNFPDDMSPADITKAIEKDILPKMAKEREPEEKKPEPESGGVAGFKSSLERMQADYYAAQAARGVEGAEEEAKKHRERAAEIYKQPEFLEHPIDYLTGLAGQSAPYMLAPLAAGAAGTLAAPVLGLGALGAAALGTGAAFGVNAAQFTASNLSRQLEEGKSAKDLEAGYAALAALPQAALDTMSLKMLPGLGRIFEKAGLKLGEREIEEIAKQSIAKRVVITSGTEGLTESAQQVFERAQAGLNLTDAQARQEYFDNFIGGALLGGVIGVPGHAYEKMKAEDTLKAKEYEAGLAAKKAEEEAAKVTQTAVPDAQGNVALPTFTPSALQRGADAGASAASTVKSADDIDVINQALNEAAKADAEAGVPKQESQAAKPVVTDEKKAITDLIGDAYAEHGKGTEVLKALKPKFEAMGITDAKEQKAIIDEARTTLSIPKNNTKAGREAMPAWQQQWKESRSVKQPTDVDLARDQSGAAGAAQESGIPTGGAGAPISSGMVPTGGAAESTTTTAGAQPAPLSDEELLAQEDKALEFEELLAQKDKTLGEEEKKLQLTDEQLAKLHDEDVAYWKDKGFIVPNWAEMSDKQKEAALPALTDKAKTSGMLPSKSGDRQMPAYMAALAKEHLDKKISEEAKDAEKDFTPKWVVEGYGANREQWEMDNKLIGDTVRWKALSADERAIFNSGIINGTPGEFKTAFDALHNYRSTKAVKPVKDQKGPESGASYYELNRIAYNRDMPEWKNLTPAEKEAFLKEIKPGGEFTRAGQKHQRAVSTEQIDAGFNAIAPLINKRLEAQATEKTKAEEEQKGKAQREAKKEAKIAEEEVEVGKELPTLVKMMLGEGGVNNVLAYIAKKAQGLNFGKMTRKALRERTYGAAALRDLEFRHGALTRAIFKNVAASLMRINFSKSTVVVDPNNKVIQQLIREGKLAAYDPKTDTFYFTKDGMDEMTVLHEIIHAGTIKILYAFKTNPESLTPEQRAAAEQINKVYEFAKDKLEKKYPNQMENVYEFVSYALTDPAFQAELANIQAPALAKFTLKPEPATPGMQSIWAHLTKAMMKLYGLTKAVARFFEVKPQFFEILTTGEYEKEPLLMGGRGAKEVETSVKNYLDGVREKEVIDKETIITFEAVNDLRDKAESKLKDKYPDVFRDSTDQGVLDFASKCVSDKKFAEDVAEAAGFGTTYAQAKIGITKQAGFEGNALLEVTQAFQGILAAPEAGIDLEALPAKKPTKAAVPTPARGSTEFEKMRDAIPSVSLNAKNIVKAFSINKFAEKATRLFQNDRAAIKNWQRRMWLTGRYSSFLLGFNNIYDQLTLSSGNADWLYRQYIQKLNEDTRAAVANYAKVNNLDIDTALKDLGLFAIAIHEEERREVLYLRTVDLTDAEILTDNKGNSISPNEARNAIFAYMDKHKLELSGAEYLRAQLEAIVNDKKNFSTDPSVDPKTFDRTDRKYNVAGYSTEQIEAAKEEYEKHKEEADKVLNKLNAINETTLELNRMANYMSEFADNYIMFYGFKNYVPFKGKNFSEDKADIFNRDGRKLGGDFQEDINTFEGRLTVPENPILQVMADGAKAAMRAGRKDVTQSIYNAVKDGTLDGEVMKFGDKDYLDFEDRKNDDVLKQLKGETKIFHYMPNGKVAVIQINNREQREAIRRTYRETNPVSDYVVNKLNTLTGLAGQMHTRYKITFAPVNFVRDVLTNAWSIGAEGKGWLGPLQSFRYLSAVALDVATGKLFKSWRFAALYSQNKTGVIEQLAKNDSYYKDLLDYTKTGGKVSYIAGIAPKGQLQEIMKSPQGKLLTKEKIDRFFDIWIDTFEMASRVSAFRIAKATITADLKKKGGATKEEIDEASTKTAAAYAKNLANFEQVGEWGKALGALFMFYRPSATGAVRAMDAVAPAFNLSMERAKLSLPEFAAIANIKEKLSKNPTETEEKKLKAELAKMEEAVKTFEKNYAQLKVSSRIVVAALAGAGMAVYWMAQGTGDDDELGRNRVSTDDMTRWTKFARFHIPGFENPIQIPWGFGLGAFAAMGAQVAAMSDPKNPTNKIELLGNMVTVTLDSFMPLPFSRIPITEKPGQMLLDSITPSLIRPISEFYTNVDALGHQIYNNRQSKFGDAYTGGDNIPESYKYAAKLLAESTNGAINWSPNTMYFFANNYADGVSSVANSGINIALWLSGKKDFNSHTDTMIFDSFFGSRSNFDSRQWSKVEADLKDRSEKVKMFKEDPLMYAKYLAANPLDAALQKEYDGDVQGRLKELRAEANKWRTMRGIDIKTRTALVKNAVLQENMIKYHLIQKYKALGIEL